MSLLDYFPKTHSPLPQQEKLLEGIEQAFKDGHKFVICCAPTGSGKSFISKTLAEASKLSTNRWKELIDSFAAFKMDKEGSFVNKDQCENEHKFGAYALTITKSLQDQYIELFNDARALKGKCNYTCRVDPRYDVEGAPCMFNPKLKDNCVLNGVCDYYNARSEMLQSQFGVLNYSMFLALPEHVRRREYIVCDEASEIEDELMKKFSRFLSYKVLKKLGYKPNDIPVKEYAKFRLWLGSFSLRIGDEVQELAIKLRQSKKNQNDLDIQKYKIYGNLFRQIKDTIDTWKECEYIIETNMEGITLKPLRVDKLAEHIFDYADKVVLMSATIIDPDNFAKTLGIKDFKYIEVDSGFNPKFAPIYSIQGPNTKLNYKNLQTKLPSLAEGIFNLCELHKNEKGIIHTHTNEITQYLKDHTDDPRFLFRLDSMDNEKIIKLHMESSEPTILVSPSMAYGVDLKEDLARFQILCKAAFMPLGDQRIKRLADEDPAWYINKMLNNLIQACGRGVRTKFDKCITYILDGTITDTVIRNKNKIPKSFLDRFL